MSIDYYNVLGVDPHINERELKSAYYALAKRYHPDKTGDDSREAEFKAIAEAWSVLSSPQKRAAYDSYGYQGPLSGVFRSPLHKTVIDLRETGSLFDVDVRAYVNTVNTAGVMGKGIAAEFKRRYPEMFVWYTIGCRDKHVVPGRVSVWPAGDKLVINFVTKEHWRNPSRLEWISTGLDDLARVILERNIESIALPALGCSNGKLDFPDVYPLIEHKLANLNTHVIVFAPEAEYNARGGSGRA